MIVVDDAKLWRVADYPKLVETLKLSFAAGAQSPARLHLDVPGHDSAKFLIMPSLRSAEALGVKLIAANSRSREAGLPTINGIYVILDPCTGQVRAMLNAAGLTELRTAAVCALASAKLSREDSASLLMVGTGALASPIVRAHLAVRPIERVMVWGRTRTKAVALAEELADLGPQIEVVSELGSAVAAADIVCSATSSDEPLIFGRDMRDGTHLCLVGSFTPKMREADDRALTRASLIVVDSMTALEESGEFSPAVLGHPDLAAIQTLGAVLSSASGRLRSSDVTIFKSVGVAHADLSVAEWVLEQLDAEEGLQSCPL